MDSEGALQPVTLRRNLSRKDQQPIGWIPKNQIAKNALLLSIIQCIVASAIELYIAIVHRNFVNSEETVLLPETKAIGEAIIAYHALFILSQIFQLILLFDAVSLIANNLVETTFIDSISNDDCFQLGNLGIFYHSNETGRILDP